MLDNLVWESSAGFRLESSDAVRFYARNDHIGLMIPYEYMGIDHADEPDFQTKAKHIAAKRWVEAANNWDPLGEWAFHVCMNPQLPDKEMEYPARAEPVRSSQERAFRGEL